MDTTPGNSRSTRYDLAFKLQVVRTTLEKNLSYQEARQLYRISHSSWSRWVEVFRSGGEEALRTQSGRPPEKRKPSPPTPAVREQVIAVKRQFPLFGIARIWHWLRRTFLLAVSRREIRDTLAEEGLLQLPPPPKRAAPAPRRFERARPNQLWQSDITTFTLARGLRVYLIGFLDDHSRYLVGWGLHAAQTGGLVLEVLRQAIALHGRPEEILTDNGRQYTTWRGETDFERELKREGIRHFTSRAQHPQTLGKIEAFWGHMKREFLSQVLRAGLEEMRESLGHWMNYYNFQRPHEGIGNVAPAERFFQYGDVVRAEIERRLKANEKELALAEPRPQTLVGQTPIGASTIEVRKEGGAFVVSMGSTEIHRLDPGQRKEVDHETAQVTPGADADRGSGNPDEGRGGAVGACGGAVDPGGVRRDGAEVLAILQAGRQDGGSDDPGGETAGAGREEAGPDRRGECAGGEGGGAAPGGTAALESGAPVPEAGAQDVGAASGARCAEAGGEPNPGAVGAASGDGGTQVAGEGVEDGRVGRPGGPAVLAAGAGRDGRADRPEDGGAGGGGTGDHAEALLPSGGAGAPDGAGCGDAGAARTQAEAGGPAAEGAGAEAHRLGTAARAAGPAGEGPGNSERPHEGGDR